MRFLLDHHGHQTSLSSFLFYCVAPVFASCIRTALMMLSCLPCSVRMKGYNSEFALVVYFKCSQNSGSVQCHLLKMGYIFCYFLSAEKKKKESIKQTQLGFSLKAGSFSVNEQWPALRVLWAVSVLWKATETINFRNSVLGCKHYVQNKKGPALNI